MADASAQETPETPKSSKLPMIIGLVLAILGGAGGFFATSNGLILAPESQYEEVTETEEPENFKDIDFVPMEPLTITLPRSSRYQHLLFRAELEVVSKYKAEVEKVLPRVIDVFNGYLRALEVSDIEAPEALTRLRSQMLRRAQIVAGPGRINDLLVMEFVLN